MPDKPTSTNNVNINECKHKYNHRSKRIMIGISKLLRLYIQDIEKRDLEYITYKTSTLKSLLELALDEIEDKEAECENLQKDIKQLENTVAIKNTAEIKVPVTLKQYKEYKNLKKILGELRDTCNTYIKTPDFFEGLDSKPIITHDEYITTCTRHNLASEIISIVKKYDKKG